MFVIYSFCKLLEPCVRCLSWGVEFLLKQTQGCFANNDLSLFWSWFDSNPCNIYFLSINDPYLSLSVYLFPLSICLSLLLSYILILSPSISVNHLSNSLTMPTKVGMLMETNIHSSKTWHQVSQHCLMMI